MGLEIINELRKSKGLTSEQLSNQSGVPLGTLNKILSGATKDPKLETLRSIARTLGCSLDDFDDSKHSSPNNNKTLTEALRVFQLLSPNLQEYALNQIKSLVELQEKQP